MQNNHTEPVLTGKEMFQKEAAIQAANSFAVYNNCHLGTVDRDFGEVWLDIVPDSFNFQGSVHGGACFTLADMCAGIVSRTDGRLYVTQQANAQFIRAARHGRLTARGISLHRGKTSCLIEVRITDEADRLVFIGTFLFHCVSERIGIAGQESIDKEQESIDEEQEWIDDKEKE